MKKIIEACFIFTFLFCSTFVFGAYVSGEYYFCEDENGGGVSGIFSIQQRNGTWDNPYHYDPEKPSREYMYFSFSSYPYPNGYLPIIQDTQKEIFLQGSHLAYKTSSKKDEPLTVIFNKKTMEMNITILDFKGKINKIQSQCCKNFKEAKFLDDGTYLYRKCI